MAIPLRREYAIRSAEEIAITLGWAKGRRSMRKPLSLTQPRDITEYISLLAIEALLHWVLGMSPEIVTAALSREEEQIQNHLGMLIKRPAAERRCGV